jgi:hypothetical protein
MLAEESLSIFGVLANYSKKNFKMHIFSPRLPQNFYSKNLYRSFNDKAVAIDAHFQNLPEVF